MLKIVGFIYVYILGGVYMIIFKNKESHILIIE